MFSGQYSQHLGENEIDELLLKEQQKENDLRKKVEQLSASTNWSLRWLFLTWVKPLEALGHHYNLQMTDLPAPIHRILSTHTVPALTEEYNKRVKQIQIEKAEKIGEIEKKLILEQDLLKKIHQNRYSMNDGKTLENKIDPIELKYQSLALHQSQKQIPIELTSPSDLKLLQQPKSPDLPLLGLENNDDNPFRHATQLSSSVSVDNLNANQEHFSKHPAIVKLNQLDKVQIGVFLEKSPQNLFQGGKEKIELSKDAKSTVSPKSHGKESGDDAKNDNSTPSDDSTVGKTTPQLINSLPYVSSTPNLIETLPNLWFTIAFAFKTTFFLLLVAEFLTYSTLLQPMLIKLLFKYFKMYKNDPKSVDTALGLLYTLPLALISYFQVFANLLRNHFSTYFSFEVCGALMTSVFMKLLRIAPYSIANNDNLSIGNITNLLSHDAQAVLHFVYRFTQLISGPIIIIAVVIMLALDFGKAALVTMTLLLLPYPLALSYMVQYFERAFLQLQDIRIKTNMNILNGLRIAKLYHWEPALQEQLLKLRQDELNMLKKLSYAIQSTDSTAHLYPFIVNFATLTTFVSINDSFSSEQVILLISYLNTLATPLQAMGEALSQTMRFQLCLHRLGAFFDKEDLPVLQNKLEHEFLEYEQIANRLRTNRLEHNFCATNPSTQHNSLQNYSKFEDAEDLITPNPFSTEFRSSSQTEPLKPYAISITNCDLYWSSFQTPFQLPVLTNITLQVKPGEIVGIISPASAGKTALLTAILGELYPCPYKAFSHLPCVQNLPTPPITVIQPNDPNYYDKNANLPVNTDNFGQNEINFPRPRLEHISPSFSFNNHIQIIPSNLIDINGKIAYCAQTPWIMNATVRDNIIMNLPYDGNKFKKVVEASALGPDLSIFADGELSIIAEGGLTLSGGQMARVQVARALYHADVSDIVILDDIFAAVDAKVAHSIFFKGVKTMLAGKAVLMALNSHYDFLQECDSIVYLDATISHPDKSIEVFDSVMEDWNGNGAKNETKNNTQSLTPSQLSIYNTLNDHFWIRFYQYSYLQQKYMLNKLKNQYDDYILENKTRKADSFFYKITSLFNSNSSTSSSLLTSGTNSDSSSNSDNGPDYGHTLDELGSQNDHNYQTNQLLHSLPPPNRMIPLDELNSVDISNGYRPPTTIYFQGSFADLIALKLPLLFGHTFSNL
jgi:ABC-type multidrug transport system fused ATPase/permease subunit